MRQIFPGIALSLLIVGLAAAPASALTGAKAKECKALNVDLAKRQKELMDQGKARDKFLELVEMAGDEWEAAEALRSFGAENAAKAKAAKREYRELKKTFEANEALYQEQVAKLNADVADFNRKCASGPSR